ncbi:tripartite tricarboxylate transporter TctB family protein [Photobacterium makurazakiensis]|uniref:tripartite tricarboxylate transporter TctB family protein n=1 Tax=Photobacterium makurazakiensis TaxID=2910234 RepID=UPI003D0B8975
MFTLNRDKLTAWGAIVIAIVVIGAANQYSYDSSYFPITLGFFILALAALILLRQSRKSNEDAKSSDTIPVGLSADERIQVKSALGVFGGIIAYALTVSLVNYEIATALFLACTMWSLGYRKVIPVLALAVGLSAGLYFVFFELLSVSRPESLFFY